MTRIMNAGRRLMPPVRCPDCGKDVSGPARFCGECGSPLLPPNAAPSYRPTQAIEATGKRWKAFKLVGWASLFFAFVSVAMTGSTGSLLFAVVGILAAIGGIGAMTIGRFGAWWHHG